MSIKKCDGFTLIEVLLSFSLLNLISLMLVPVIIELQQERLTLREQEEALYILEEGIHHFMLEQPIPELKNKQFEQSINEDMGEIEYCLQWQASNHKLYQSCLYAKR
ncbi:prepilin-type N-terminal cleavage/methylation domain-containing protein [Alkalihalobacillus sp. 1P02AB]|uniref:prepilin-type N-terminal cleavage/methylation domain-containing protein n=1 Tax=Alkalihalobacillus sp. 1P02AB TaxID=3132260 RepID=UPI0039A7154B